MSRPEIKVNFENVIGKRIYDDECGWRDMTTEEQKENLEKIKEVLLESCRGTRTETARAIRRMSIDNLPVSIGIYKRLNVEDYTAGQDYRSEMRYIKNTIKKQC